jgi:hypothetical protein
MADAPAAATNATAAPLTGAAVTAPTSATDTLTPATQTAASGALIEPEIVERIDTAHPAVDSNPRAGQPVTANTIEFNDPNLSGREAVEAKLKAQAPAPADKTAKA